MRWQEDLFSAVLLLLIVATPIAVAYGPHWWYLNRDQIGWRIWISRVGIIYGILILAAMVGVWGGIPRNNAQFAEFPYVHHWSPILARMSMPGVLFAVFGKGRVRATIAITAFGGIAFAMVLLVWL